MKSNSFFIFGPRGSGKTTFLKDYLESEKKLWIDLLEPFQWDYYSRNPGALIQEVQQQENKIEWVVIDEVQKIPKLLDAVHFLIEETKVKFALTGSSARKLKRGAANLLAGRAFINYLFPLTHFEMGEHFDLNKALQLGTLPKLLHLETDEEKNDFLRAYALTYLKEEVWEEHLIRQLDPFRRFLEVAAQTNSEIINYSNIAKDVGADTKTVQSYFQILEDTLIGFLLEPYHRSIRKRQSKHPKFYFFDTGAKRALEKTLGQALLSGTYAFGKAFEHFVILEAYRLNAYFKRDFSFSYLRTKDHAEVDLVVERPGMPTCLVEIKSSGNVDERDTRTLESFLKDFETAEGFCLSNDRRPKKIGKVHALFWQEGLKEIGLV